MRFVGKFDRKEFKLSYENTTGFSGSEELKFANQAEMLDFVLKAKPSVCQGVLVVLPNGEQFKIISTIYHRLSIVRGNEPNILACYLKCRNDLETYNDIYSLYPLYSPQFEEIEDLLEKVTEKIHQSYVNRYIRHNYVNVPQNEYQIMRRAHEWHLQNKFHNRVYLEKVKELVYECDNHFLFHLLCPYLKH
jgi:hypothetical protein